MHDSTLDRREFTRASLLAMFSGVVVTITGCGGGGYGSGSPTTPTANGKTGVISANHGHIAVITNAELMAGGAVRLTILGSADHDHTVELTAAEVVSIRDGGRVAKVSTLTQSSTTQLHDHTVTFN